MSLNKYELLVIINPTSDSSKVISQIEKLVKKFKGKVETKDEWGTRTLSYPIKRKGQGFYVLFIVEMEAVQVKPFAEALKLEEEILRQMIIKANF
ncbi:MAG: 30S ribosomal protein S6 [Candidatus Cloacimonetes bacterium]|nr:30S ribosomal protein S6 [Candidatus Cloacimonadota bacterium]